MSAPKRYNWKAALNAFKASGLPLERFHKSHAAEFSVTDWVPCCQTMRNHLKHSEQGSLATTGQRSPGSNLTIIELPAAAAVTAATPTTHSRLPTERWREKTQFLIQLPDGTSMQFSTRRAEALAIELMTRRTMQ